MKTWSFLFLSALESRAFQEVIDVTRRPQIIVALSALLVLYACESTPTDVQSSAAVKANKPDVKPASAPAKGAASAPAKGAASAPVKGAASAPVGSAEAVSENGMPSVSFVFPPDGATIFTDSALVFAAAHTEVVAAGSDIDNPKKGHHHLIVDGEPVPKGHVVPRSETHLHYGKGETETRAILPVGKHKLTMQFANGAHVSYGPDLSQTISVTVVEPPKIPGVGFTSLKDKEVVQSPLTIQFSVQGFGIRPAGEDPKDHTTGHHHLIIDGTPVPTGAAVPANEKHIHYGKGQTQAEITLEKGDHALTLQFADGAHRSYGPSMSATVQITVR
jgi:hypothetical protein